MIATLIPFAVVAVLCYATYMDMRAGKIPNWSALALFGFFIVMVVMSGAPASFGGQLIFAGITFLVGLALYATAGVPAGAVKLLAGAALFMPPSRAVVLILILIGITFALGLLVNILRKAFGSKDSTWKMLRERVMPLSLPITATTILGMFWLTG